MRDCQQAVERAIGPRVRDVSLECILALAEALDRRLDRIQAGVRLPTTPSVSPPIPPPIRDDSVVAKDEEDTSDIYPSPPVVQEEIIENLVKEE